ncbi:Hypothetical protein G436_0998 [Leptospira interrogans serovar Hardjo str. Norma]|uniref:Uncharacterized protein n=1 Tax=Leptospira interrogans serovar Hardjo str. Norma TaxID=1279460 RepID=A0A0M4NHQ3_LEPIR|nr:Hypothetical protein G436_0998 [Leptospira interrogans serovar Hardjo str. Norma]EKO96736.1 hypothetical protein LEP1GSC057_3778 [Leptospira interrogans str. Brem 329]
MDRRSGLKKAHFSSVPTRISLFTCKKYVFLIEKNFPNHPKIGKTQHNALYESRCGVGTKFYRGLICRNSGRFILRSNTWLCLLTANFASKLT